MRPNGQAPDTVLVVLDGDGAALASEQERLKGAIAAVFVDKAAWLAMQRMAATGLLRFTAAARVLHRSPALPVEGTGDGIGDKAGAAMAEADRALRMARVLAAGGFPEEVPALLGRSVRQIATALMVRQRDTSPGADGDDVVRRLVAHGALPPEALTIIDAAGSAPPTSGAIEPLMAAASRLLTTVRRNEPGLSARDGGSEGALATAGSAPAE